MSPFDKSTETFLARLANKSSPLSAPGCDPDITSSSLHSKRASFLNLTYPPSKRIKVSSKGFIRNALHPKARSAATLVPKLGTRVTHATTSRLVERKLHDIALIPINILPDPLRSVFNFPLFNAVQSCCFQAAYASAENMVVSAPTGSGKTAIFELAICSLFKELRLGSYKVIYQAPTKALCAERKRGEILLVYPTYGVKASSRLEREVPETWSCVHRIDR